MKNNYKKYLLSILVLILLGLFTSAVSVDDYYSRVDHLLGSTMEIMVQANALPIVTGVESELKDLKNEQNYYSAAGKLADQNKNYAWSAYENSKKRSAEYYAKKINAVATARLGSGQTAEFLDEQSGRKYAGEEKRYAQQDFFKQFKKGDGSADIYIENIGVPPEQLLSDLFSIELPELPDTSEPGFIENLPNLKVEPLEKWQSRLTGTAEDVAEQLKGHWQIKLEPLNIDSRQLKSPKILLAGQTPFMLGVKIINPEGEIVTAKNKLPNYVPYLTSLPLPEGETSRIKINLDSLDNIEKPVQQTAEILNEGLKLKDANPGNIQSGQPLVLDYALADNINVVELAIYDEQGNKVYAIVDSKPNPAAPVPLIWDGTYFNSPGNDDGKPVKPGSYTVGLQGRTKQNQVFTTASKPVNVTGREERSKLQLNAKKIINNGTGQYFGYANIIPSNSSDSGLEKIYLWLNGSETAELKPISTALYLSFSRINPDRSQISAEQTTVGLGRSIQLRIALADEQGRALINVPVSLYSRRNGRRIIDVFSPETARTNASGYAEIDFRSEIPGEAEIYGLSDMLWINKKPLTIKITPGRGEYL